MTGFGTGWWRACVVILALFCAAGRSQAQSVGPILSYDKTPHGLTGKLAHGSFAVTVYSEHVVRLQVSQNDHPQEFSYALVTNALPDFRAFSVVDDGNAIRVTTASLSLEISKKPRLRAVLRDAAGAVLTEDEDGEGLGTAFSGEKITIYNTLQDGERFVGLGEELGNLDRRGTLVTLQNTDNYKYEDPRIPMYVSIPFFYGIHHGKVYGVFLNNSHRAVFDFGATNKRFASYSFDGGDRDEFFLHDDSIARILEHYSALTGRMPLPPMWSLGYQQSRCSYVPESQVMWIAQSFRDKQIPLDGIVLDADYLKDYEPFRIDTTKFPDMAGMARRLRGMNIELAASVNPCIKMDPTYDGYTSGLKQDVFLRYPDGKLYVADMYPNTCHFPDFTDPKAREWWIQNMKLYQDVGINGYWNDMNEPLMPENVVHDFDGHKGTAAEAHNIYGMQMARSSFESLQKFGGNKRPFVLSRSGFAGIQRYSAVWSGDNQTKDEHILLGVLLNTQMGLAGVPFMGPDLGGYTGDGNKGLFKRWVEIGVFSPYLRNHREQYAAANEPWAYGEEAEAIAKTYIGVRYRLMPYLYSTFHEASRSGMPISRCLCMESPFDAKVYDPKNQYEFQFGDAFLLNPMTSQEHLKSTYLPQGEWYDLFTDEKLTGGRETIADYPVYRIPIFVRAGSIVPMQSAVQSTKDKPAETLFVHVYFGGEKNRFTYYEDDGNSLDYQKGVFYARVIEFEPGKSQIVFRKPEGSYATHFQKIALVLHGFPAGASFRVNGKNTAAGEEAVRLMDPLGDMEILYFDKAQYESLREKERTAPERVLTLENGPEIVIEWQ